MSDYSIDPVKKQAYDEANPTFETSDPVTVDKIRLMVYITHYDKDNKIIDVISEFTSDNIHRVDVNCYEMIQQTTTYEYYIQKAKIDIFKENTEYQTVSDSIDNVSEAPVLKEELKDRDPVYLLEKNERLTTKLYEYFNNLFTDDEYGNEKAINIYFNSPTEKYEHYVIDEKLIQLLLVKRFKYHYYNLSLKILILKANANYTLDTFYVEDTTIELTDIAEFYVKDFYLKNSVINPISNVVDSFALLSINSTNLVDIDYIDMKDKVFFISINMKNENNLQWIKSKLSINNIMITHNKDIKSSLDPIIRIVNCYYISLFNLELSFNELSSTLLRIINCNTVELSNINVKASHRFHKGIINIMGCNNVTLTNAYATQVAKTFITDREVVYFVTTTNHEAIADHKYINISVSDVGFLASNNDSQRSVSISGLKVNNFHSPFKYTASLINSLKLMESEFNNVSEVYFIAKDVSIFNPLFNNDKLSFDIYGKLYFSSPDLYIKESLKVKLFSGSSFISDFGSLRSKVIKIEGDNSGKVICQKTRLAASEELIIKGIEHLSLKEGRIEGRNISLSSKSLTGFSSNIISDKLENLSITGEAKSETLYLDGKIKRRNNINLDKCIGQLTLKYQQNNPLNINISDSLIKLFVTRTEELEAEGIINFSFSGDCIGKTSLIALSPYKLTPIAEGNFNDLMRINSEKDLNLMNYKDKILYGTL